MLEALEDDSRATYEVYADWLVAQGDPRGELIHVQLAREAAPENRELATRERELIEAHEKSWLPELEHDWFDRKPRVTWRRGFIGRAELGASYQGASAQGYAEVARSPLARFIRELEFHTPYSRHGDGPDDDMIVDALLASPPPPTLRVFALTCGDNQRAWSHLGNIERVYPLLTTVEHLVVDTGRVELGAVALPACHTLRVINSGMRGHVPRSIAAASWQHLEQLDLFFGNADYGADCIVGDLAPLLADHGRFPALKQLGLGGCEFGDDLARLLVDSPLLPQLATLDLSGSTMGTGAAEALLAHPDRFAHLQSLDLTANFFSLAEARLLEKLCPSVLVGQQNEEIPDWGRYVDGAE
ncbi:MAG: hypothetical protein H0T89_00170 [Deltaproteobacteria bacterium]|nr:hypothetical protein [Deltaproteobacteria bacterium]MDQ3295327.1 hypothetical protein [Myxococcota bacterium]